MIETIAGEKVAVITATWDSVKVNAYRAHIQMVACMASRLPPDSLFFACKERAPIAEACLGMFQAGLKAGADWLLWIDDDVIPPPDVYFKLRAHADPIERPVVSALAFFRYPPFWPSIFKFERWGDTGPSMSCPMPVLEYPENELVKVDGTGLCCTLIHRSVFEKISKPWFHATDHYSPDGFFMARLDQAKIPVFCHTGIVVGHLGVSVVNDASFQSWRARYGVEDLQRVTVRKFRLDALEMPDETTGELIAPDTGRIGLPEDDARGDGAPAIQLPSDDTCTCGTAGRAERLCLSQPAVPDRRPGLLRRLLGLSRIFTD